jgi:phospholipase C
VKPACVAVSDHPGVAAHEYGPEWVGYVVNQILTSPAAQSTAIFVIWDDWGGFYDHVAPPALRPDRIGPGLRTPLLLVSAYGAAPGAVVHTTSDYASIMKFSEDLFGLPRLNAVDAGAADLVGFFNTAANATPAPVPTIAAAVADPYVPSTMCPAGAPRASANMED